MENFTITTQMTAKEYAKATLIGAYKRPAFVFVSFFGLYLLTTVILDHLKIIDYYRDSLPIEFFIGLLFLFFPGIIALSAVRHFNSNPAFRGVIKHSFSDTSVAVEGEMHKSEYAWSCIVKQKEMGKFLVLFQSAKHGLFIDKTKMTEEQLEFIKAKVAKK